MAILCRFISALVAAPLLLSSAALSQPTNTPPASTKAGPGTSGTADDKATNPSTREGGDSSPIGRAPPAQQSSPEGSKETSKGTGPDPTTVREPPSINGNGTAGEGT
jgi:hypothetical protein